MCCYDGALCSTWYGVGSMHYAFKGILSIEQASTLV
jgi:hypothetical protein